LTRTTHNDVYDRKVRPKVRPVAYLRRAPTST